MGSCKRLPGCAGLEGSLENAIVRALYIERPSVLLAPDIHPPPSLVSEARLALFRPVTTRAPFDADRKRQRRRQGIAKLLQGQRRIIDGRPGLERGRKLLVALESPVADELSIETAVAAVVDFLVSVIQLPLYY